MFAVHLVHCGHWKPLYAEDERFIMVRGWESDSFVIVNYDLRNYRYREPSPKAAESGKFWYKSIVYVQPNHRIPLCVKHQKIYTAQQQDVRPHLVNERTLRPGAQDGTPLVGDEGDHAEDCAGDGQDQAGVLAADVVEELAGEERRDGSEGVTQETLASDGGGGRGSVTVGRVRVGGFEDEVDSEGDGCQGDGRRDPVDVAVLREGVNEEADR